jgi:hypothetical protein
MLYCQTSLWYNLPRNRYSRCGKKNFKLATRVWTFAVSRGISAVKFCQRTRDCQTNTESPGCAIQFPSSLYDDIKYARQELMGQADAGVLYTQYDFVSDG